MKEDVMLEVFRIARDLAVAEHKHDVDRSPTAKALSGLWQGLEKEEGDPTPRTVWPTPIADTFERAYRFMASELAAAEKPGD